ncbi:uncharacterized protein LOC131207033 [Anopheles bellator]|uniref:uncharacterized protein LOC131207033 n=1 Tax=Anopheles bellator TaxID=139047 RepID=UPI0026478617|nr:uncharacterized protein LOC131207033 [Anopheles bellator]
MKVFSSCGPILIGFLAVYRCPLVAASGQEGTTVADPGAGSDRTKRSLVYTYNSCAGVLFALSIPLLITGRNIFFSYNFEMNYNMPTDSTDYTQGILKKGDTNEIEGGVASRRSREADSGVEVRAVRPSITRKKVYRMIELNLERYGFAGKRCILRMICDLAHSPVHGENGVFGDLMHIVFTPSLSVDERLPSEFGHAEWLGHVQRNCTKYRAHCPTNPMDLMSIVVGTD